MRTSEAGCETVLSYFHKSQPFISFEDLDP